MQHQRQVVERDHRMQVICKHFEQLGQGPMAGKGLRDAQQRVVARKVSAGERGRVCHDRGILK